MHNVSVGDRDVCLFSSVSGMGRKEVSFGLPVLRNDGGLGLESFSDVEKNMVT